MHIYINKYKLKKYIDNINICRCISILKEKMSVLKIKCCMSL